MKKYEEIISIKTSKDALIEIKNLQQFTINQQDDNILQMVLQLNNTRKEKYQQ